MELFHTTPHIKQQEVRITIQPGTTFNGFSIPGSGTATGTLSGDHFRVITWAPMNLMFRYHRTRLQPYIGVGPGVFFGLPVLDQIGPQRQSRIRLLYHAACECVRGMEVQPCRISIQSDR
jgi:hypothetical protein